MAERSTVRIGTRGSALARWQAEHVAQLLRGQGVKVELQLISTQGDRQQVGPIGALGGQGVFTKEIQQALLDKAVDVAVHSLKDLPTEETPGLTLGAIPPRERTGDALVLPQDAGAVPQDPAVAPLPELPAQARVGTGSLRRQAQLLHARPDLRLEDIRGNVDTRLRKLDRGDYDAIVLAEAGLRRLGLEQRISRVLPRELVLPAVGQGALGLEIRYEDDATREALAPLDDPAAHAAVLAERSLLRELRGGCLAPVGALATVDGLLRLTAVVLSRDGRQRLTASAQGPPEEAVEIGRDAAESLRSEGADALIAASRS